MLLEGRNAARHALVILVRDEVERGMPYEVFNAHLLALRFFADELPTEFIELDLNQIAQANPLSGFGSA